MTRLLALAAAFVLAMPSPLLAQNNSTAKPASAALVPSAMYFSAQGMLSPLPFDPFPDLPLYDLGQGRFSYDDSGVNYAELFPQADQMASAQSMAPNGPITMDAACTCNGGVTLCPSRVINSRKR